MPETRPTEPSISDSAHFRTTHWSVVLATRGADSPQAADALQTLCRVYWYPLYAYVRRTGRGVEDAQDLTQEFFARLLEKRYLGSADPARGRFRTFLLSSLKNFLVNEWARKNRQKRGSGCKLFSLDVQGAEERYAAEPADQLTPEKIYEKRWAATLLERVLESLRSEYAVAGNVRLFDVLKDCVWGANEPLSYEELARQLSLTEGAVRVAVHRLRRRCRELLRTEIAHTVAEPGDVDEEVRNLIRVMGE